MLAICLFGFASGVFAYSDCSPTAPAVPCQKIGTPSVVYDAFGYSARLDSSNNYFDSWGQLVFYNSATHAGVLGTPSGNQAVSASRRSGFPTATVLRYLVNIPTGTVYSGPTYSTSGSWFKEIWPNSSWYPTLHIGDFQWAEPAVSYLSFPLAGYTAYNAPVSSVMDQGTLGTVSPYASERNGTVSIFNGESGTVATGCHCYSTGLTCDSSNYSSCAVPGYLKSGGGSWTFTGTINYSGSYVYYDGHPGYDYPQAQGTAILAAAGGTLCVAPSTTSPQTPSEPWRNTTQCPLASAPTTQSVNWTGYHALYILHGPMFINGLTDEYMTVFLHSNNLESTVLSGIYNDGYKVVTRLQEVAAVGNIGASGAYHMHLEVYKKVSGSWARVDPYGNGTSNILWQH